MAAALQLPFNATKVISRARRHSAPDVVLSPMAQSQDKPQVHSALSPEPAPKTLVQRVKHKFDMYQVKGPDNLLPSVKPKEVWTPREDKRKPSPSPVPRAVIAKGKRCGRCTQQEMWAAYDVFRSMDHSGLCKISRHDYMRTMSNYPTMDKLRVLKRVDLENRFRENAKEVTLEEFLRLMWPQATEEDTRKMMHWVKLRDAQELIRTGNYTEEPHRLKEVFELLDKDHNRLLDDHELLGILEKQEVEQMIRETAVQRTKFKAGKPTADTSCNSYLSPSREFKKLLCRGRSSSSSSVEQMIQKEEFLKNKLTFDEFCHVVQSACLMKVYNMHAV